MSHALLFSPLTLRSLTLSNRIIVSPMCQYSCTDGLVTHWHLVHLGSRAVGGSGLILTEAAAVNPEGRISPDDAGIWSDAHVAAWKPITAFVKAQGSAIGIQLAHAGRKACSGAPWTGRGAIPVNAPDGWQRVAPSAVEFPSYLEPRELSVSEIHALVDDFANATRRSLSAGFDTVEIHAAHGYLLHQFLSPIANKRTDEYGGNLENRMRFPLAVCQAIRDIWPRELPVLLRVSATDWVKGGFMPDETVQFCSSAKAIGVDMVGVSTAGNAPLADYEGFKPAPGYQVPFAQQIRTVAQVPTYAVGLISEPQHAESILLSQQADAIALGRAMLRDPYWPRYAARALGVESTWPNQYARCEVDAFGRKV